ncbi:MAG: GAF domain-containing protein [Acidimicrobiales bacterium]
MSRPRTGSAGHRQEEDRLTESEPHGVDKIRRRLLRLEQVNSFAAATSSAQSSLATVLQAIADSARDLIGAGYAALGVIGHDGRLQQFVHSGMDDDAVERIGALPRGEGILGVLIRDPVPLRLGDLSAHPALVGFPTGHPPMSAFLGVPIQIGGDVFGNLYLTEPVDGGEFTSEDEALAVMMAVTASGAIANARRLAESELRRRWLAAASHLSYELLAGGTAPRLELITNEAALAADADLVTLTALVDGGTVELRAASGPLAASMRGTSWPAAGTLTDQVMRSGKPVLVDKGRSVAGLGLDVGPVMVVPLAAGEHMRGAMSLTRAAHRPAFTATELDMVASFAYQATLALELLDARESQVRVAVLEDKERIAEDLHDHVIQELFATGMSLQSLAGMVDRPELSKRLSAEVESLDNVIKQIRTTIFQLQLQPDGPDANRLRADILAVTTEQTSQLGYSPHLHFSGALDWVTDAGIIDDILAVIREALSNCARHAQATAVTVSLVLADQWIELDVTDNGRGIGRPDRSSGLANMRQRAERHRGSFTTAVPEGGGTRLVWTAHLPR